MVCMCICTFAPLQRAKFLFLFRNLADEDGSSTWRRVSLVRSSCRAVSAALRLLARSPGAPPVDAEAWEAPLCCLSSWAQTVDESRRGEITLNFQCFRRRLIFFFVPSFQLQAGRGLGAEAGELTWGDGFSVTCVSFSFRINDVDWKADPPPSLTPSKEKLINPRTFC